MVFWIAVLIGGLFAWAAAQVGFFSSWIMLFNLVLSAYLAVFVAPLIIDSVPATTDTPYGYALVLLSVAIATLVTAYAICYTCLSGRTRIEFPALMDKLGAGVLGFLGGFLVSSFLGLVVSLTPLPEMDALRPLGLDAGSQRATRGYVCWWCDVLHGFVGSADSGMTSGDAVDLLLNRAAPPPEEIHVPASPPPPVEPKAGGQGAAVDPKGGSPEAKKPVGVDATTSPGASPVPAPPPPAGSGTRGPSVDPKTGPPIRFP